MRNEARHNLTETDAELDALIRELFLFGHSAHEIARTIGLSEPDVKKALVRLGLQGSKPRRKKTSSV